MPSVQDSCRVCHRDTGRFVSPCACEGSMKYVHSKCLSNWVFYRRSLRCEVCGMMYSVAKVLNSNPRPDDAPKGLPALVWICARRYMQHNIDVISFLMFRVLVRIVAPVVIALLQYALDPFVSVKLPWHSLTGTLTEASEFTFLSHLTIVIEFMLFAAPFDIMWDVWREWCASHDEVFPADLREGEEDGMAEEGNAAHQALPETDSEEHEEGEDMEEEDNNMNTISDDDVARGEGRGGEEMERKEGRDGWREVLRNHSLEPAVLPEENAAILEAIVLAQQQSQKQSETQQLIPSAMLFSGGRFIVFHVSLWVLLLLAPEAAALAAASLWRWFDGGSRGGAMLKKVLLATSSSDGVAQMRFVMLLALLDAIRSSTVVAFLFSQGTRIFSVCFFLFAAKRMRGLPKQKAIVSMLVFFRGLLNMFTLVCFAIPTVCLVTTFFCLDFFGADVSFGYGDDDKAWRAVYRMTPQNTLHRHPMGHPATPGDSPLPVVVLKALDVLSRTTRQDMCWNYGEMRSNGGIVQGERLVVDGDDPLLFPIFAATTLFSNIDSFALVSSGYMVLFLALLVYYHVWIAAAALPAHWFRWSVLHKLMEVNVFQVIRLLDVRMLLRAYGEIFILAVVTSYMLLRHALTLVRVADSALFPMSSLQRMTTPSSACWLRVLFLIYTAPQDEIEVVQRCVGSTLGYLFEIWEVAHGGAFSLPRLLSRVVRLTAFTVCYWLSAVLITGVYAISSIYMVSRRMGFLRGLTFAYLNVYKGIRFVYPNAFPLALAQLRRFIAELHLSLPQWGRMWWLSSFLGLWVTPRTIPGDGFLVHDVEGIPELPVSVRRTFSARMRDISLRLNEYAQTEGVAANSVQRIQQVLRLRSFHNYGNCFLLENDVNLLLQCLQPPGVSCCLCFVFIWTILLLVFPFIVGSALFSLVRSFFSTPHCYTGSKIFSAFMMWLWGAALMVILNLPKPQRRNICARLRLYFFCGYHSFTLRNAVVFVLVPVFMQVAGVSIVPYAVFHTLMAFMPLSLEFGTGAPLLTLFGITIMLSVLERRQSLIMEIFQRMWIRLHAVRRRMSVEVVLGVAHTEPYEHHPAGTQHLTPEEDLATSITSSTGLAFTHMLTRAVGATKHACTDAVARSRGYFYALSESCLQVLKNVADRENVVRIVFVNRPET